MPAVREIGNDTPEVLEIVEVRPGVTLQLNAADRKAWQEAAGVTPPVTVDAIETIEAAEAAPKPRTRKG